MSWSLRVRDRFSAAHFLREYAGKCENMHGHTFAIEVEIGVDALDATGMGYDFTEVRRTLAEILPDHTLLNDVVPFNPTAENLARHFFQVLKGRYPVKSVTIWESADAGATYSEGD